MSSSLKNLESRGLIERIQSADNKKPDDPKDLCIYVVDCNQVDRFIFYRNLPDFLVKKTLHKQLTFDRKYVCFKITNSARYEWGSRYGKRKERETDT